MDTPDRIAVSWGQEGPPAVTHAGAMPRDTSGTYVSQDALRRAFQLDWEALSETHHRARAPFFGSFRVEKHGEGPYRALWSAPGISDNLLDDDFVTADAAKTAIEDHVLAFVCPDFKGEDS